MAKNKAPNETAPVEAPEKESTEVAATPTEAPVETPVEAPVAPAVEVKTVVQAVSIEDSVAKPLVTESKPVKVTELENGVKIEDY